MKRAFGQPERNRKMKLPRLENFKWMRAVCQALTSASSHVVILLLLLLPGRLGAVDLDLMLRGSWPPFPRGPANAVAVQNGHAFVAAGTAGLVIVDVNNPANPERVGSYDTSGTALAAR